MSAFAGLLLEARSARAAWRSAFAVDPLPVFPLIACLIYLATLARRTAAGWHGRRAIDLSMIVFVALVVAGGARLPLPGRHGS